MKKLMILAVTALTLAACAKTFVDEPVTESPIGFGTWAGNMTKAITDPRTAGSNTFGVGDSFAVYGYKSASDESGMVTVFDDVAVEMTAAGVPGTWTYSGTKFWDSNKDKYTFFAISPSSVGIAADGTNSSTDVNPQAGTFVSRAITFAGDDSDILVADKETVLKAAYGNVVQLDFNHVAAWVDFKVNKAPTLADATVTVSAFALGNIQTAGALSVTAYSPAPTVSWSNTATGSYNTTNGVTPVSLASPIAIAEDTAFNPETPTDPAAATTLINTLIVKPQTFTAPTTRETPSDASNSSAQKLTISYTIDGDAYNATLWLSDFDIVNDNSEVPNAQTKVGSWAPGKHYTFYITLDARPIVFGATINDWTPQSGYHYLIN